MILDAITLVLLLLAIYKGWHKGLIVAVCSFMGYFIGWIAALTFSARIAGYFQSKGEQAFWLPFLSFAMVIILTVFLLGLAARLLQKILGVIRLGWLNRLAGMLLYLLAYFTLYSIILFYASLISLISPTVIAHSVSFKYIQPWGPNAVAFAGRLFPWFKDVLWTIKDGLEKWK